MSWFLLAIIAVGSVAASDLIVKYRMGQSSMAVIQKIWITVFVCAVFAAAVALLTNNFEVLPPSIYAAIGLVALLHSLAGDLYFSSFKSNSVSVSSILCSVSVLVSTSVSLVLLNEFPGYQQLLGMALVLLSVVLVNYEGRFRYDYYNLLALFAGIVWGIGYSLNKYFLQFVNPAQYIAILFGGIFIWRSCLHFHMLRTNFKVITTGDLKWLSLSGLLLGIYAFFAFNSYLAGALVGVIDAIDNSQIFIVIIFEVLVLKDRLNIKKKMLLGLINLCGLLLISEVFS